MNNRFYKPQMEGFDIYPFQIIKRIIPIEYECYKEK